MALIANIVLKINCIFLIFQKKYLIFNEDITAIYARQAYFVSRADKTSGHNRILETRKGDKKCILFLYKSTCEVNKDIIKLTLSS